MSDFNLIHEDINSIAKFAKDNYDLRNQGFSRPITFGSCNWYHGDDTIHCKVSPTVSGQIRYTFSLNGKRISRSNLASTLYNRSI